MSTKKNTGSTLIIASIFCLIALVLTGISGILKITPSLALLFAAISITAVTYIEPGPVVDYESAKYEREADASFFFLGIMISLLLFQIFSGDVNTLLPGPDYFYEKPNTTA